MDILAAVKDQNLLGNFLGEDLTTWMPWLTALRAVYGHPIEAKRSRQLVEECTGRDPDQLPPQGFDVALFLVGRRSGKSRAAALIASYEAALAGREAKLARGERGVIPVLSPTKGQSRIVTDYLRAIFQAPAMRGEVVRETQAGFELRNGTRIEILSGDFKTIRGYTLCGAAVVDEAAFFGVDLESKVKSDTELIRALMPGLATTGGKLIAISSPYARKGWCYQQHQRHYGNDASRTLVWNCPSRTMNPTLAQSVVDAAIAEDLQAAKSEYLGEFRDDIAAFISRELVEACVVPGRSELLPAKYIQYHAFADISGGRADDSAMAVAHQEGRTVVIDCVRRWKAPHSPHFVIGQIAAELKSRWGLDRCCGDRYAGNFNSDSFAANGIRYSPVELNKSELYLELLPRLCSQEIELLDNPTLINQIASLERRTRSGSGRDSVDHPKGDGRHDDLSNACAGASFMAAVGVRVVGAF